MDMTPQQIDELLDRIRDERGEAIDPARITDLLAAEDSEATAAAVYELAEAEFTAARAALAEAESLANEALRNYSEAKYSVRRMRHELAVVRTATGYKTAMQAQADAAAQRATEAAAARQPWCTVCGSPDHGDRFHADPVTGLIGLQR